MNEPNPVRYSQIPALGGHYFVGSDGSIHRITEIKPSINKRRGSNAYAIVSLFDTDGRKYYTTVHRIVASCFIGPRPEGLVIDHVDGNKLNNSSDNLEYVTSKENTRRAYAMGTRKPNRELMLRLAEINRGSRSKNRKFTDDQAIEIIGKYKEGKSSMKKLGEQYGCDAVTIFNMIHGKDCYQYIKKVNAPSVIEGEERRAANKKY